MVVWAYLYRFDGESEFMQFKEAGFLSQCNALYCWRLSGENSPARRVWPVTQLYLMSHQSTYLQHHLRKFLLMHKYILQNKTSECWKFTCSHVRVHTLVSHRKCYTSVRSLWLITLPHIMHATHFRTVIYVTLNTVHTYIGVRPSLLSINIHTEDIAYRRGMHFVIYGCVGRGFVQSMSLKLD